MSTNLSEMSLSQLAKFYNAIPGNLKPVSRFASRADALRRIERAQKALSTAAPAPEKAAPAKPAHRPTSKRAKFLARLLSPEGVTEADAKRLFGWQHRECYDVTRQTAKKFGYKITFDDESATWHGTAK